MPHDFGSPAMLALYARMYKIAGEAGVSDISNDSVRLMTYALEVILLPALILEHLRFTLLLSLQHHLKDIIANCKQPKPGEGTPDRPIQVTTRDLMTTVQVSPYLLGEELPVNQVCLNHRVGGGC